MKQELFDTYYKPTYFNVRDMKFNSIRDLIYQTKENSLERETISKAIEDCRLDMNHIREEVAKEGRDKHKKYRLALEQGYIMEKRGFGDILKRWTSQQLPLTKTYKGLRDGRRKFLEEKKSNELENLMNEGEQELER